MRVLEDGRLPLDNTAAERALRGIAVGRKNWMFAGSDESGGWAAVMYSLIRSCELNGVEPWKYLRDVLSRLAEGWPEERLGELLPHCWPAVRCHGSRVSARCPVHWVFGTLRSIVYRVRPPTFGLARAHILPQLRTAGSPPP
ncbi:transposase domain-containing protein [Nannocystaceae bacterium ST9]